MVCVTAEGKAADAHVTYVNYLFSQAPKHPQTNPDVGCIWSCGQVVSLANGGLVLFGSALLYWTSLCNLPYLTGASGKNSLMVTTNELRICAISTVAGAVERLHPTSMWNRMNQNEPEKEGEKVRGDGSCIGAPDMHASTSHRGIIIRIYELESLCFRLTTFLIISRLLKQNFCGFFEPRRATEYLKSDLKSHFGKKKPHFPISSADFGRHDDAVFVVTPALL